MLAEKLFKMASQLLILVLMARVLPPQELGQLMYCFALASIFLFLNQLGLDTLLVKKFIDHWRKKSSLLWHAFAARLLAALLCVLLVNLLGFWLVEPAQRTLLFCISLYHLFLPFSTFEWFYQAEGRSDRAAIGLILGQLAGLFLRLYAIFYQPDLVIFGAAYVLEAAVTAIVYLAMARQDKLGKPRVLSMQRMEKLTREAFPLMISGAVILLYMKIDQVMLGYLASEAEVAYYVAATRLSEAWYFVGLTLIAVYIPKILAETRDSEIEKKQSYIGLLGATLFWSAVVLAVFTAFFSNQLIHFFYGYDYQNSALVLAISIFSVPFVYIGALSSRYSLEMNDRLILLKRSVISLSLNLTLNMVFIPIYGATGAAASSLISQIFSGVLSQFILLGRKNYFTPVLFSIFTIRRLS